MDVTTIIVHAEILTEPNLSQGDIKFFRQLANHPQLHIRHSLASPASAEYEEKWVKPRIHVRSNIGLTDTYLHKCIRSSSSRSEGLIFHSFILLRDRQVAPPFMYQDAVLDPFHFDRFFGVG